MHSGVIARTILLDRLTDGWIADNPGATVVNIACGLDTRCYRMSGFAHWYNLDLPDVIDVRSRLLPENGSISQMPMSAKVHIYFDLAGGEWAEDFTPPTFYCKGDEYIPPKAGDVKREGYRLTGWEISRKYGGSWGDKGEPGKDGADGKDVADGNDGVPGINGKTPMLKIDDDNLWYVSYDEGTTWTSLGIKATGDKGNPGKDGADGKDGTNGKDGTDGKDSDRLVTVIVAIGAVAVLALLGNIAMIVYMISKRRTNNA